MRAIEVIVIVAMVLAFYTLIAKSATFDILPTPDITDLNSIRSEATEVYAAAMTLIGGSSPDPAHSSPASICEDAVKQGLTQDSKLVILRLDDVQAWAWRDIAMRITEDTLKRDIAITLGVIPKDLGDDKVMVEFLREKSHDQNIEIAQHGTTHSGAEFAHLGKWEALKLANAGKEELVTTLGVKPTTFIPPENAYSESTTSALKSLDFEVLSAGFNELEFDGKMQKIGFTTSTAQTQSDHQARLILSSEVASACNETSNPLKVCVIMIHPQDYANEDGTIDEAKYAYFTELLDRLETEKNFFFFTFEDLFSCLQEYGLSTQNNPSSISFSNIPGTEPAEIQPVPIVSSSSPSENDCVSHNETAGDVTILCDATFNALATAMKDSPALRNDRNGTYNLDANIVVNDGATFSMSYPGINWLRLEDRSHITVYGKVEFVGVRITSWDSQANSVIESVDGTVFRGWISFVDSEGGVIKDSEISHLGYQSTIGGRSGFDIRSTHDLEITGSKFHNMYFAFYSSDAYNIKIVNNEYHSNILYALDPHSGTHAMEITGNHVHHNNGFGIICSLDCYDIFVVGNNVHDNGNAGIMLSRNTTNSIVRHNIVYNHANDDGIVVSQSANNYIYENTLTNNKQGIYVKLSMSNGNTIERNTITGGTYGIVVATAKEGNIVRGNTIEQVVIAEYYLLDGANLIIEQSPFWKIRVEAGPGLNTITIRDSGGVFLFPVTYDTNTSAYVQTLTESSITLQGELQGSNRQELA